MRPLNYQVFAAANIAQSHSGIAIDSEFVVQISAQAVLTGSSPTGTLKFQATNDDVFSPTAPTNWSTVGTTLSISATGVYLIPAFDTCYQYMRLVWTATSGTGAITANIKTVGY